ncbi:AAA family ATPase [Candidatus Thiodiazotropha sp. LNASS1]|uniref:AAA family ATPase n=1 Tax=Candidatus Thiodiazotropha sp. LNASS1 TaxID=3096260 RepID=UPI0034E0174C
MTKDSVSLQSVNNIDNLEIDFDFSATNIIVITGRNGIGKTTIIKSFYLLSDPDIFSKSSGENAVNYASRVSFSLNGIEPFGFYYNARLGAFDTKDALPGEGYIVSELPIPYGARFQHYSSVSKVDAELKFNIASADYKRASNLIAFLSDVYSSNKFDNLKSTKIKNNEYYFILKEDDYYLREDHFSSGEFFLIQLYRLIGSGAKLILVDELDVALDAVAQVNLYSSIKPILQENNSRLIVVSHSLAFMETVDEGCLYYLEKEDGIISLEVRSFSYIKSDLFGFQGYDRYFLTEDEVLEEFIEFLIRYYSIACHYQHITIGVAGVNQVRMIVEKNDDRKIFADSNKVLCVVDGDVFPELQDSYNGPTRVVCTPVDDLQSYLYLNREALLSDVELPTHNESSNVKRASKQYWKWLLNSKGISAERLYRTIVESEGVDVFQLKNEIEAFLSQ